MSRLSTTVVGCFNASRVATRGSYASNTSVAPLGTQCFLFYESRLKGGVPEHKVGFSERKNHQSQNQHPRMMTISLAEDKKPDDDDDDDDDDG